MKKQLHRVFLVIALIFIPSCGAVLKALPQVVQYVNDAQMVLDMIDRQAKPLLEQFGTDEVRKEYDQAYMLTYQALQFALRSTKGTDELSKEQIDEAFADFKEAYKNLISVLQRAGLMNVDGSMKALPGIVPLQVKDPLVVGE